MNIVIKRKASAVAGIVYCGTLVLFGESWLVRQLAVAPAATAGVLTLILLNFNPQLLEGKD